MINMDLKEFKDHLLKLVNISRSDLDKIFDEINEYYSVDFKEFVRKKTLGIERKP